MIQASILPDVGEVGEDLRGHSELFSFHLTSLTAPDVSCPWTAVSWLFSPLGTALGRPFSQLVADSSAPVFLLVFTFPVFLGLLLGAFYRAR